MRRSAEVIDGADVFLGLSAGGVLKPEMVAKMAAKPLIFALANPTPEIMPEDVKAVRPDAVIASGRTDYANQINNALAFPGLFRGALDVQASEINETMKLAAADAIARVIPEAALSEDYIIPSVFDKDVVPRVARAVAMAARESGVARRRARSDERSSA